MFDYISVREASKKTGVTERWIQQLCKRGRIDGAIRLGGTGPWLIPTQWNISKINHKNNINKT
ncbi:hypothetical protein [Methanobrevibacter sp.]|uniref:hypothetical protein n=1 Tax=Methanobrevibacter sp. TaxID=66852 RepID=UPI0039753845